jgi:hypothetical protein
VRDAGLLSDVADASCVEAAPREHANRCLEQQATLVDCERAVGQG